MLVSLPVPWQKVDLEIWKTLVCKRWSVVWGALLWVALGTVWLGQRLTMVGSNRRQA